MGRMTGAEWRGLLAIGVALLIGAGLLRGAAPDIYAGFYAALGGYAPTIYLLGIGSAIALIAMLAIIGSRRP